MTDSRPNSEFLLEFFCRHLHCLSPDLLLESFASAFQIGPPKAQLVQSYCQDLKTLREDPFLMNYSSQTLVVQLLSRAMLGKGKPNPLHQSIVLSHLEHRPFLKMQWVESIDQVMVMLCTNRDKIGFLETNQQLSQLLQFQNVETLRKGDPERTRFQMQCHLENDYCYIDFNLLFSPKGQEG